MCGYRLGLQIPVKLLGSTIDTYGHMSLAQERQILESNGILSSQFTAANQPQYKEYEEIFKNRYCTIQKIMEDNIVKVY